MTAHASARRFARKCVRASRAAEVRIATAARRVKCLNIDFVPESARPLYCTTVPGGRPRKYGNNVLHIGNVGRRFLFCRRPGGLRAISRVLQSTWKDVNSRIAAGRAGVAKHS